MARDVYKRQAQLSVPSDPYRHTINRGELAAIAHDLENVGFSDAPILTDSLCCIHVITRAINHPQSLANHIHETLAYHVASLLKTRDQLGLLTEIGKVQAHIGIIYTETVDSMANEVVTKAIQSPETYMTGGHNTLGRYTWPIRLTDQIPVANLRTCRQKQILRPLTIRALTPSTKHGTLIRSNIKRGVDFSLVHISDPTVIKLESQH